MHVTHAPQNVVLELFSGPFILWPFDPHAFFFADMEFFESLLLLVNAEVFFDLFSLYPGGTKNPHDSYGCPFAHTWADAFWSDYMPSQIEVHVFRRSTGSVFPV